jgi:tRNA U34 5-methylaminomethyl-2-thiouridine-forming methyltransferase MnmC
MAYWSEIVDTVYLAPEERSKPNKKYDAIVNGMMVEFKNMHGASFRTLKDHFLDSREQAPNVFINLEKSPLTKHEIINTLYATRNSVDYGKKNKHKGGKIILKIKGQRNLIYLNVDDLKT